MGCVEVIVFYSVRSAWRPSAQPRDKITSAESAFIRWLIQVSDTAKHTVRVFIVYTDIEALCNPRTVT